MSPYSSNPLLQFSSKAEEKYGTYSRLIKNYHALKFDGLMSRREINFKKLKYSQT